MFIASVKDQLTNAMQWAGSGSKLTYAAIATGLVIGLVLFKVFFKSVGGFFHSVGFSVGSGGDPAVAAQPGLSTSSRMKLFSCWRSLRLAPTPLTFSCRSGFRPYFNDSFHLAQKVKEQAASDAAPIYRKMRSLHRAHFFLVLSLLVSSPF